MFRAAVHAWFPDGAVRRISPDDGGTYYQACIHPAGTHALFFGGVSGPPRVWQADLDTGATTPLTPLDSSARHAVYAWNGDRIAFVSDRGIDQDPERIEDMPPTGLPPSELVLHLFTMRPDGSDVRQLTDGPFQDQRPCMSPDGKHIVFVSNRGGGMPRLWRVPADGSADPMPLLTEGWGYRPWYAADGQSIFFFTDVGGRHHICRIPADGGTYEPLPNDDRGRSHGPFADPGGTCLIMHSTRDSDTHHLWEVPLDGSAPRRLDPPGHTTAAHGTRARTGAMTFDAPVGASWM